MSSIPAVVDALLQLWRTGTTADQVIDGQPLRDLEPDVIVVGFSPSQAAVEAEYVPEMVGEREAYDIVCLVSTASSSFDARARRDRVFALYGEAHDALAANPSLGGLVIRARCNVLTLDQAQTDEGATATIEFVVHVDAS